MSLDYCRYCPGGGSAATLANPYGKTAIAVSWNTKDSHEGRPSGFASRLGAFSGDTRKRPVRRGRLLSKEVNDAPTRFNGSAGETSFRAVADRSGPQTAW